MITEVIRYQIEDGQEESFRRAYADAGQILERSPDCLGYEILQGIEETQNFVVLIRWTSVEKHLEGFRKSADFPAFFAMVRPFFDAIQEMKHYQQEKSEGESK